MMDRRQSGRRAVARPWLEGLEARRLLSYNVTLNGEFEAGTSIAGEIHPYDGLANFQATNNGTPVTSPEGFVATIAWGDGTTSQGTIYGSGNAGLFEIRGAHSFPDPSNGEYNIQVELTDPDGVVWYGPGSIATVDNPSSPPPPPVLVGSVQFNEAFDGAAMAMVSSPEYDTDQVDAAYQEFLERPADLFGSSQFTQQLENGLPIPMLDADLIGSSEFFGDHGGTLNGFVQGAYQDLLDRPAGPSEVQGWTTMLQGGVSRTQVAEDIANSPEHLSGEIEKDYVDSLQREPSPGEINGWLQALADGLPLQGAAAKIQASPEEFGDSFGGGGNTGQWIRAAYDRFFGRAPDFSGYQSFMGSIGQVDGDWASSPVYIDDSQGDLLTVDLASGVTQWIGLTDQVLDDIAMDPLGNLYGVDQSNTLYRIDPNSGATLGAPIPLNVPGGGMINAIEFRADGTLFGAGGDHIYTINPTTGVAAEVGSGVLGSASSAGDIAFDVVGDLFVTTTSGTLVEVPVGSTAFSVVVESGLPTDLYGLILAPGGVFDGFSNGGQSIVTITLGQNGASFTKGPNLSNADPDLLQGVYGATVSPTAEGFLQEGPDTTPPDPSKVILRGTLSSGLIQNAEGLAQYIFTGYGTDPSVGPISVAKVTNLSNTYLVSIAGTQLASLKKALSTLFYDSLAFQGLPDAYVDAVVAAIKAYGVPPGSNLILAGHSLGGMEAENLEALQDFLGLPTSEYHILKVITFGSPLTGLAPPNLVAFYNPYDPISQLDLPHNAIVLPNDNAVLNSNQLLIQKGLALHLAYPMLLALSNYDPVGVLGGNTTFQLQNIRYYSAPWISNQN